MDARISLLFSILKFLIILILSMCAGLIPQIHEKKISVSYLIQGFVYGQVILWGLFQIMAVPMIQLKLPFDVLYYSFLAVLSVVGVGSLYFLRKAKGRTYGGLPRIRFPMQYILILTLILIFVQMMIYVLYMHLDDDDARWMAEAGDAIEKGVMYLYNPATGEYLGGFAGELKKDVLSPMSMYIAVVSRFCGFRPAELAHTYYAPVLLVTSYCIYGLIGALLFEKNSERIVFLFSVAIINLFFSGPVPYQQSAFTLVRIWQGKAIVASIIIPLIMYLFLRIQKFDEWGDWLMLTAVALASCLLSGMGIVIGAICQGIYGIYSILTGKFKGLPYLLLALLIYGLFGILYMVS